MTDIQEFNNKISKDPVGGTLFATALATELKNRGIATAGLQFETTKTADGGFGSLVLATNSNDPMVQLQIADAAVAVLQRQGVDTSQIRGLDPAINPVALNVVYKDGGWIVNT